MGKGADDGGEGESMGKGADDGGEGESMGKDADDVGEGERALAHLRCDISPALAGCHLSTCLQNMADGGDKWGAKARGGGSRAVHLVPDSRSGIFVC